MSNQPTLILHATTKQQFEAFIQSPGHAVLLSGAKGTGKLSTAQWLAEQLLQLEPMTLGHYPYALHINPADYKVFGIEIVRQLEAFLKLRVPGQKTIDRLVIIENADSLTIEAQNALLKNLEEPPAGVVFILTASQPSNVLPTIRSRLQAIALVPPGQTMIVDYFSAQGYAPKVIQQAFILSGGLPGLMQALLAEDEHPLRQATAIARNLLQATSYQRLLTVDMLSKQRELLEDVLFILQQMAGVSLRSAKPAAAQRWRTILVNAYQATIELNASAQPKLVLANLMLNLS